MKIKSDSDTDQHAKAMLALVNNKCVCGQYIQNIEQLYNLLKLDFGISLSSIEVIIVTEYFSIHRDRIKWATLDTSYNNIGNAGARDIAEIVKINTTLTFLDLCGNNIDATGAHDIADAIKINTTLTSLDLSGNNIGATGVHDIAEAIKVNKTLTYLNLCLNNIGATGAHDIAEAIKVSTTLTSLDLYSNNIGATGAHDIAEAIKVSTTLTFLNLAGNNIGATGAHDIAEAIKINKTLTYLDINCNKIEGAEARTLLATQKLNKYLYINLYHVDAYINPYYSDIKELSDKHKATYKQVVNNIITVVKQLTTQQVGNDRTDRVQQALKIKVKVIDQLFEDEQDIKALFASPAVFTRTLKDNKIVVDNIDDIAGLFKKLHIHSDKYLFIMKGVFINRIVFIDTTESDQNQAKTEISNNTDHGALEIAVQAHKLTTICDLPEDMFRIIVSYLSPKDIILMQPDTTNVDNATSLLAASTIVDNIDGNTQMNMSGDIA